MTRTDETDTPRAGVEVTPIDEADAPQAGVEVKQIGETGEPRVTKSQGLTSEEFEALLAVLDPDREKAGERYEIFRRKLIRLFEWRGCDRAEDLADETINRVARRLDQGIALKSSDPYGYFCGVAHLVYKEFLRSSSRERRVRDSAEWTPPIYVPQDEEPSDPRLDCLRDCLAQVPQDQQVLLLRYYQGENNIRNRKALAGELGIPLNALRIRVHRVRRKVEDCVHDCLSR